MKNTKTTKRALLSSVMAMLICVAMLIGTTFAWFTDSASTAVNKIQAGTLDVQLLDEDGNSLEGQTLSWQKRGGAENEDVLWEPGCTYNTQQFYIKNNGNLNLKFKFSVSGITGDAKLLEVLDFTAMADASWFKFNYKAVSIGTSGKFDLLKGIDVDTFFYGTQHFDEYVLEPGKIAGPIMISGHMAESAGNEYQGLSIDGIAITVIATQATGDEDSYNGTYDGDAEYPEVVATAADFEAALDNPDVTEIIVASDITFDWGENSYGNSNALKMQDKVISGATGNEVVTFKGYGSANPIKDVTISNINVVDETVGDSITAWEHAYLEFENLTATDVNFVNAPPQLNGTCILTNCTFTGTDDKYAAWINSGNITLKNCMFNGIRSLKIHEAYGSDVVSVVVDGCTFNTTGKPGVVIGALDATTSITIKNSTFNNCAAGDQNKYIYESDTDVITFNFTEIDNTVNND